GTVQFVVGPLADWQHTFTATAEDVAGNGSVFSTPLLGTVKTTPPAQPVFYPDPASGTRPFGHHTTHMATVPLTGKTDPNATVKLVETDDTTTADQTGKFSFYPVSLQKFGDYRFTAIATDVAGNTSQFSRTITRADIAETDLTRPEVTLTVSQAMAQVGSMVVLAVSARDDVGVVSTQLVVNGKPLALDAAGKATFSSARPGVFT